MGPERSNDERRLDGVAECRLEYDERERRLVRRFAQRWLPERTDGHRWRPGRAYQPHLALRVDLMTHVEIFLFPGLSRSPLGPGSAQDGLRNERTLKYDLFDLR